MPRSLGACRIAFSPAATLVAAALVQTVIADLVNKENLVSSAGSIFIDALADPATPCWHTGPQQYNENLPPSAHDTWVDFEASEVLHASFSPSSVVLIEAGEGPGILSRARMIHFEKSSRAAEALGSGWPGGERAQNTATNNPCRDGKIQNPPFLAHETVAHYKALDAMDTSVVVNFTLPSPVITEEALPGSLTLSRPLKNCQNDAISSVAWAVRLGKAQLEGEKTSFTSRLLYYDDKKGFPFVVPQSTRLGLAGTQHVQPALCGNHVLFTEFDLDMNRSMVKAMDLRTRLVRSLHHPEQQGSTFSPVCTTIRTSDDGQNQLTTIAAWRESAAAVTMFQGIEFTAQDYPGHDILSSLNGSEIGNVHGYTHALLGYNLQTNQIWRLTQSQWRMGAEGEDHDSNSTNFFNGTTSNDLDIHVLRDVIPLPDGLITHATNTAGSRGCIQTHPFSDNPRGLSIAARWCYTDMRVHRVQVSTTLPIALVVASSPRNSEATVEAIFLRPISKMADVHNRDRHGHSEMQSTRCVLHTQPMDAELHEDLLILSVTQLPTVDPVGRGNAGTAQNRGFVILDLDKDDDGSWDVVDDLFPFDPRVAADSDCDGLGDAIDVWDSRAEATHNAQGQCTSSPGNDYVKLYPIWLGSIFVVLCVIKIWDQGRGVDLKQSHIGKHRPWLICTWIEFTALAEFITILADAVSAGIYVFVYLQGYHLAAHLWTNLVWVDLFTTPVHIGRIWVSHIRQRSVLKRSPIAPTTASRGKKQSFGGCLVKKKLEVRSSKARQTLVTLADTLPLVWFWPGIQLGHVVSRLVLALGSLRLIRLYRTLCQQDLIVGWLVRTPSAFLNSFLAASILLLSFFLVCEPGPSLRSAFGIHAVEAARTQSGEERYAVSIWFASVTVTTVGYGSYVMADLSSRVVAILLMVIGIGLIGKLSANIAQKVLTSGGSPEGKLHRLAVESYERHVAFDEHMALLDPILNPLIAFLGTTTATGKRVHSRSARKCSTDSVARTKKINERICDPSGESLGHNVPSPSSEYHNGHISLIEAHNVLRDGRNRVRRSPEGANEAKRSASSQSTRLAAAAAMRGVLNENNGSLTHAAIVELTVLSFAHGAQSNRDRLARFGKDLARVMRKPILQNELLVERVAVLARMTRSINGTESQSNAEEAYGSLTDLVDPIDAQLCIVDEMLRDAGFDKDITSPNMRRALQRLVLMIDRVNSARWVMSNLESRPGSTLKGMRHIKDRYVVGSRRSTAGVQ